MHFARTNYQSFAIDGEIHQNAFISTGGWFLKTLEAKIGFLPVCLFDIGRGNGLEFSQLKFVACTHNKDGNNKNLSKCFSVQLDIMFINVLNTQHLLIPNFYAKVIKDLSIVLTLPYAGLREV